MKHTESTDKILIFKGLDNFIHPRFSIFIREDLYDQWISPYLPSVSFPVDKSSVFIIGDPYDQWISPYLHSVMFRVFCGQIFDLDPWRSLQSVDFPQSPRFVV